MLLPLLAAFIHVASELTYILNSARLLPDRASGRARTKQVPSSVEITAGVG
jgi:Cu+-exporting ATPase